MSNVYSDKVLNACCLQNGRKLATMCIILCVISATSSQYSDFNEFQLPAKVCENVSNVEIRFRDYHAYYFATKTAYKNGTERTVNLSLPSMVPNGFIPKILKDSVKYCCPNVSVKFVLLENSTAVPVTFLAQRDVYHAVFRFYNNTMDRKKFVFYFPEFSQKDATNIYKFPRHFLPLVKSRGHAIIMLKSETKFGLTPAEVLMPSLPLLAVMFAFALLCGIVVWFLVSFHFLLLFSFATIAVVTQWLVYVFSSINNV